MRAYFAGDTLEVFWYERSFYYDYSTNAKPTVKRTNSDPNNMQKSRSRSQAVIKRLILENFNKWIDASGEYFRTKFVTLTFKANMQDLDYAHREFMLFMKRLNYAIYDTKKAIIQYLAVIEFQKRGAIHYHILFFNVPYKKDLYETISDLWKHNGFSFISTARNASLAANYMTKYVVKAIGDKRLDERKRYLRSRNLKNFITLRNQKLIESLLALMPKKRPDYQTKFEHEKLGMTHYAVYDTQNVKGFAEACQKLIEASKLNHP